MAQFARSPELHRTMTPFAQAADAAAAWVEQVDLQARDAVAAFAAKLAEMSRGIVSAFDTYMASVSIPRVEIFSETLDQVRTVIEMVPYRLPPTSAPVGGMAAPGAQPSVPGRWQRNMDAAIVGVIVVIVGNALWYAIVWHAQTGRWDFEELLCYFVQLVQHLD
jgi:hypothetical protein